jgi:hypothetical protein
MLVVRLEESEGAMIPPVPERPERKLSAKGRDKILAILEALSTDCNQPWSTCRHCLAMEEFEQKSVRKLLRALLAEVS